jgi:ABC transport system ATP-binding/permease protein
MSDMSLLSVNNLTCTQAIKTLFENATFGIEPGDKIAVIGTNGSGKTTLLSLLAQSTQSACNEIAIKKSLRITYLPQQFIFNPEHTILDHLFRSNTPVAQAIRSYQECLNQFNENPTQETESALTSATSKMDHINAWDYEERVSSILRELNIYEFSQKMKDLSGGMQKKIALAQAFFEETDLLILDEPTNHLDITTIEWLEGMLSRQASAIVMVTHDRYFLNKVCTKILEIDQQRLFVYKGNYQTYLEQREQRYSAQDKHEKSIQSVLRVELAWLSRGPKARSTKQKARKQNIDKLLSRKTYDTEEKLDLNTGYRRLGKKILELKDISKSFDEQRVIDSFSYSFKRGERIGILGPNGAGKTTLLNLIMERIAPDSGCVDAGINTAFGYFDQHSQVFDLNMSIYKHVSQIGSQITCHDGTILSASKLLERFLFPSSTLKTPIGKLSGGERRRLHLVCLLLKNPNFLLFDEPTNDLDIQTLSVLEDFLLSFSGCVIIISHDRYFMDRVVDQLLVFNMQGKISSFSGNYSEYMSELKVAKSIANKKANTPPPSTGIDANTSPPPEKKRLTYREQEELKQLEKEIDSLENDKKKIDKVFTNIKSSADDYASAGKQIKEISEALELKIERWETLAEFL